MKSDAERVWLAKIALEKWSRRKRGELLREHLAEANRRKSRIRRWCADKGHGETRYAYTNAFGEPVFECVLCGAQMR